MCSYGEEVSLLLKRHNKGCADDMLGFDCGDPTFNEWLYENAENADCVSYCFADKDTNEIVCYASLAATAVFDRTKQAVPAVEIKAFAVNAKYQHMPYSRNLDEKMTLSLFLLYYIISQVQQITEEHIGARLIVLYSVPNAVNFYKKAYFEEVDEDIEVMETPDVDGCKAMCKYIDDPIPG